MFNATLLFLTAVGISLQATLKKYYTHKGCQGVFIFTATAAASACLFFILTSGFKLDFTKEVLPYSIGFGVSYCLAVVTSFLAVKIGSLSLTSLITSYSLIVPTFYGLIFLDEAASVTFFVGFAILLVSLFLINSKRDGKTVSLPWMIVVLISFVGNGVCSTFQNVQQKKFDGMYKNELMIIALGGVALVLFTMALLKERRDVLPSLRGGAHAMVACGLANGTVNLMVMLLAVRMNASLMFPIISGGGIVLSWSVSKFIYKEKLTKYQNAALVLGIIAVVLMNL